MSLSPIEHPPYYLLIDWPDDPETNSEKFESKAAAMERIAYLRQMDRTEQPKNWELWNGMDELVEES